MTAHPLPGHTLYAAAIAVRGRRQARARDGRPAGDSTAGAPILNYQYRNRFRIGDYVRERRALPPAAPGRDRQRPLAAARGDRRATSTRLAGRRARLAELHRELLPLDEVDFGAEGFGARIEPYRSAVAPGGVVALEVEVQNPFAAPADGRRKPRVPAGWPAPEPQQVALPAGGRVTVRFELRAGTEPARRARVAADLTVDGRRFGQQAEALVDVG